MIFCVLLFASLLVNFAGAGELVMKDGLRFATWNIRDLGEKKMKNRTIVEDLADVSRELILFIC